MDTPKISNERELWREREGDYYANSVSVTPDGALCINVGGTVVCKSLAGWHSLAWPIERHPYTPDSGENGDCSQCGESGMAAVHEVTEEVQPPLAQAEGAPTRYVRAKNFPTSGGRIYVDGDVAAIIREYEEPASEWSGKPAIQMVVAVNSKWPMPLHLQPHQYDEITQEEWAKETAPTPDPVPSQEELPDEAVEAAEAKYAPLLREGLLQVIAQFERTIAKLEEERDEWKSLSVTAIAAENPSVSEYIAQIEAQRDFAGTIMGKICVYGTLIAGEKPLDPPPHAAVDAILTQIERAERAESLLSEQAETIKGLQDDRTHLASFPSVEAMAAAFQSALEREGNCIRRCEELLERMRGLEKS